MTRYTRRSATYIGSLTLGAKVLERFAAFVQIAVIAAVFGATTQSDLYFIASIVPLTIGTIVGEALATSTLPWLVRRQSSDDLVHHLSATFWMSAATLVVAFALYVGVMAVAVTRYAPAGSTSLLPWLAFSPNDRRAWTVVYLSSVLLLRERYTWPPFRAAAAAIFGLALMGISLIFTDSVTLIAAEYECRVRDRVRAALWRCESRLRLVVAQAAPPKRASRGGHASRKCVRCNRRRCGGRPEFCACRAGARVESRRRGRLDDLIRARNRLYLEHRGAGGRHRTLPGDAAGARSAGSKRLYAAH